MTSPSFHTKPLYNGACDGCGRRFTAGNAIGLAAQHFARCGSYVWVESTTTFVWDPEHGEGKGGDRGEAGS